jgi:putative transposase
MILVDTWFDLVNHVDNIKLHEFIVMPNHVHGIIEIVTKSVGGYKPAFECWQPGHNYGKQSEMESKRGVNLEEPGLQTWAGLEPAPTKPVRTESTPIRSGDSLRAEVKPNHQIKTKPLPEIVRQLKTFSARRVNQLRKTPGRHVWQRNYYEHVIRNELVYYKITEYILNNPSSWSEDRYYKSQTIIT